MRVLMFGWEFPPYIAGGLGTACYGMTRALAERGADVRFVLPCADQSAGSVHSFLKIHSASGTPITEMDDRRLALAGNAAWQSHVRFLPVASPLTPYMTPETYLQALRDMTHSGAPGHEWSERRENTYSYDLKGGYGPDLMSEVYRYGRLAATIADREDYDVIHAHDWMTYPAAMLAKALTGKPLVVHIHATEYDRSGENVNEVVAGIERAGLHAADLVVAVSQLTRNTVIHRYGVPPEKVKVVYNAVTRPEVERHYAVPKLLQQEKRVLFLGRVTFQKGPEYFIEAAKLVLDKVPNTRFFMAGSGDMLSQLVRRAGQLRIGHRFHFSGFLRGEQVNRMFALSNLYVMPSVSEPFGITPLEAMLYDVPVLVSRQSGVAEVLRHALKADFWDVRDMADKICAVLNHEALARELVRNCRDEMKHIRWGNAADQLLQLYSQVTGGA